MKITTQGEYGLRCVLNIAKGRGEPVTIEEICKTERLSSDYVEQLLMRLRRGGIVESQRGPGGGYLLGRPPERIKVKDVILVLEKNPFETICRKFARNKMRCESISSCKIKEVWSKLSKAVELTLSKVSIADLI